ncbi:MAG TPA: hypothetical protein VFA41_13575 [Ktedonobacteraceae bacterium]|jgi:hypothetical protein|nr:hypothetical protein [Ktedonobacteraceae bacterium]
MFGTKRRIKDDRGSFAGSIGWLFADMLLVLTILFLASNTFIQTHATTHAQAKPSPVVTPKVTPTSVPHLELKYHRVVISVDSNGLLNNNPNASNDVIRQVKGQGFLRGRRVGLIIVYGGAPGVNQIGQAETIANKVYGILLNLGRHDPTFANTSRYDPLYVLGGNVNSVSIDIFLFAR